MKNFIPTIVNVLAGGTATTEAVISGDKVLTIVALCISVATTVFTFILDCRRKWKEQDLEFQKKEKELDKQDKDGE